MKTWRDGYKAAYAKAHSFGSWDALWDWAEDGSNTTVPPLKSTRSTDLAGGRHSYIDTWAGGYKDGCIALIHEMHFIGRHNTGDTKRFFKIMVEWMDYQNLDTIIPPGHF